MAHILCIGLNPVCNVIASIDDGVTDDIVNDGTTVGTVIGVVVVGTVASTVKQRSLHTGSDPVSRLQDSEFRRSTFADSKSVGDHSRGQSSPFMASGYRRPAGMTRLVGDAGDGVGTVTDKVPPDHTCVVKRTCFSLDTGSSPVWSVVDDASGGIGIGSADGTDGTVAGDAINCTVTTVTVTITHRVRA